MSYPEDDWRRFGDILTGNIEAMSSSDRTSLINDAFSLAYAGRLAYAVTLDLTKFLKSEKRLGPWETAISELNGISSILTYTSTFTLYNKFVTDLLLPIYKDLGWQDDLEGDSYDRTLLRPLVTSSLCRMGNKDCLQKAGQLFLDWKENGVEIPLEVRAVVYTHGLRYAGDDWDTWSWMFNRYQAETNPQEKIKLMQGLAASKTPWILKHLIELARDESNFRSQDYFTLLTYISRNQVGLPIVWDFYRSEWDYLVKRFTLNDRLFGRFVSTMTQSFSTELRLAEMKAFFKLHPEAGAGENYRKIALETVETNIKFLRDKLPEIQAWLEANVQ